MNTTEIFYKIGKTAFLPLLAGMFFFGRIRETQLGRLPQCVFRSITGLYCPGCGGTRAFYHFANGNWAVSWQYHPVVLYAAVCYVIFMTAGLVRGEAGRRRGSAVKPEYLCYFGIVLILGQWILKIGGFWTMP